VDVQTSHQVHQGHRDCNAGKEADSHHHPFVDNERTELFITEGKSEDHERLDADAAEDEEEADVEAQVAPDLLETHTVIDQHAVVVHLIRAPPAL
jgi:hypothetical protein